MTAIYNEIDVYAAQWTRNLIAAGHVAPGVVDERSIAELAAADVAGPGQRHFFSGIAVWSYALRLAGVPDDADLWTGSCPCQGLSDAGRKLGFADPRHLWPVWFPLIRACRPGIVLGEQVASRLGLEWLDLVCADLESAGYTVRAADTCAAGVGAPHIRQRIYFVAYAARGSRGLQLRGRRPRSEDAQAGGRGKAHGMADAERHRREGDVATGAAARSARGPSDMADLELGNADELAGGRQRGSVPRTEAQGWRGAVDHGPRHAGALMDPWSDAEWIACTDGKQRPVGRGVRPLVDGSVASMVRNRARRLKGYGNAIIWRQAASFIAANLDVIQEAA